MKVLVSACLLGKNCKYNGGNNLNENVLAFLKDKEVISICPEVLAGLGTPRKCMEISGERVIDIDGKDITSQIKVGIDKAIKIVSNKQIELAILQSRSPTCGVTKVYDGSFSGKLIEGQGLFAEKLIALGYTVKDASNF